MSGIMTAAESLVRTIDLGYTLYWEGRRSGKASNLFIKKLRHGVVAFLQSQHLRR